MTSYAKYAFALILAGTPCYAQTFPSTSPTPRAIEFLVRPNMDGMEIQDWQVGDLQAKQIIAQIIEDTRATHQRLLDLAVTNRVQLKSIASSLSDIAAAARPIGQYFQLIVESIHAANEAKIQAEALSAKAEALQSEVIKPTETQ